MTTPITKPPTHAAAEQRREWCCGTPITGPHTPGCAYEPSNEPPPTPSLEVPAAAPSRRYGLKRTREEFDVDLPSGSYVRLRRLDQNDVIRLNLIEVLDGFTPELMSNIKDAADTGGSDELVRALSDPDRNKKMFGPVDRVVAACVVAPKVSLDEPSTEDGGLVNVEDVDLVDKLAIFNAAFGEQLSALKSVRGEQADGARDLSAGESVQPAP